MALIKCPECGKEVSDKAKACIHCGYPLESEELNNDIMYCPYCGKKNPTGSEFCAYCGRSFTGNNESSYALQVQRSDIVVTEQKDIVAFKEDLDGYKSSDAMQREQLIQQKQMLEEQRRQHNSMAKCPRCGSVSLSANKKGFGVGKAIVGTVLLGEIGILAGGIGANKTIVTCLNCGYKFQL